MIKSSLENIVGVASNLLDEKVMNVWQDSVEVSNRALHFSLLLIYDTVNRQSHRQKFRTDMRIYDVTLRKI